MPLSPPASLVLSSRRQPAGQQHLLQQVELDAPHSLPVRDGHELGHARVADVRRDRVAVNVDGPLVPRGVCVPRAHVLGLQVLQLAVDVEAIRRLYAAKRSASRLRAQLAHVGHRARPVRRHGGGETCPHCTCHRLACRGSLFCAALTPQTRRNRPLRHHMTLPAHSTSKLDDERERAPAGVAQSAKWQALPSPAHARGFCCVPLALRGSPQPCTGHPARQTPSRAATSQERCSPHGDARALPRGVAHEASARAALGAATGATHGSARVRTCMAAGAAGVRYSAAGGQRRVGSSGRAGSSGKMRGAPSDE